MTKKEILKLIDDKYGGDRNKFYEDYPDIESFKNGGKTKRTVTRTGTDYGDGKDAEGMWWKNKEVRGRDGEIKRTVSKKSSNYGSTGFNGFNSIDDTNEDTPTRRYSSKSVETPRISKTTIDDSYDSRRYIDDNGNSVYWRKPGLPYTQYDFDGTGAAVYDKRSYYLDDKVNKKTGAYKSSTNDSYENRTLVPNNLTQADGSAFDYENSKMLKTNKGSSRTSASKNRWGKINPKDSYNWENRDTSYSRYNPTPEVEKMSRGYPFFGEENKNEIWDQYGNYDPQYANGGRLPMYAMGGDTDPILTGDIKKPFTTPAVPVSDTKYKTNEAVDVAINENPISLEDAKHRINVGNNSEAYWGTLNSAFGPPQGGGYTTEQMQTYPKQYKQFQDDKTWLTKFTGERGRPNDSYTMYGGTNESGVPVNDMAFGDTTYNTMINPATSVIKKDTANAVTTLPGDTLTGANSLYKNPIAQKRNGGYLNSYNNGGKLPMYQNGTNNAFMTNSSNTGTSTNYNAYMPNGIDYSQPASDNTFGATNYSGSYQETPGSISTYGDEGNAMGSQIAGAIPVYGQYAELGNVGSNMIADTADTVEINGEDTGYGKTADDQHRMALADTASPLSNYGKGIGYMQEGEYGKGMANLVMGAPATYVTSRMDQKEGYEKALVEKEEYKTKEQEFKKRQALLADRESSELDKANAAANTSGYGNFMAEDGGYANFNPQAEIEDGELIEGTTGTYKAEGDTHENGGIEIGFSENGTPIAGEGGKLTKMYEGGGKMSSAFVSSNNMKVPKDMAERLLKI